MKRHYILGLFVSVLGLSVASHAQAVPTATRAAHLQIGGGFSIASPDYTQPKIQGATIYGDLDLTRHIGVEGDIHLITLKTPSDVGESTYLLGPRYVFLHRGRVQAYGKVLAGLGRFSFEPGDIYFGPSSSTYGVLAFGGGADIRIKHHISARGDFEAQRWVNFKPHSLSPYVVTIGAAYVF